MNKVKHYNHYPIETIDMMIRIWGAEKTATFCEMNAFKYRMRLGLKDDIETDLQKEAYYLKKAEELKSGLYKYDPMPDSGIFDTKPSK